MKLCINCQKEIDPRSLRCYKCRALYSNSFLGKTHSDKAKKIIGKKSSEKFTDEFKENKYRKKSRGNKKRAINGYILVKNYEHPNRNSHNDILEHILVMSKSIGRPLEKGEIVHHINCVKTDNNVENLYLFKSRKEHMAAHHSLNNLAKTLLEQKIICFCDGKYKLNNNE